MSWEEFNKKLRNVLKTKWLCAVLKSKVLISNVSNNSRRGATKAFTERGLYMLATVLKGERARQVTFSNFQILDKYRYG